jgi:DNA-binding NtrC family response regulator
LESSVYFALAVGERRCEVHHVKRAPVEQNLEVLVRNFSQAVLATLRENATTSGPKRATGGGGSAKSVPLPARLDWLEDQAIDAALEASEGNRTRAAEMLGINRVTLYKKLLAREAQAKKAAKKAGKPAAKKAAKPAKKSARGKR